jgi:hypothetical protein
MPARILSTIAGLWLMAAPYALDVDKIATDNDHIIGPVIASFAIISFSQCTTAALKFNLLPGIWLLLSPWVLGYENNYAIMNDMATGVFVIIFSLGKIKVTNRFGGGWKAIWKSGSLHETEAKQSGNGKLEML